MTDPFKIAGYTVVANSGGQTSGYNLWRHLESNDGKLPDVARCAFTNTGWEDRRTLDFLAEQERRWGVVVNVLEFCRVPAASDELTRLETKWQRAADRLTRFRSEPASFFAPKRPIQGVLFQPDPEAKKREAVRKADKYATDCFHSWQKALLIGTDSFRRVTLATADTNGRPYQELLEGLLRFREQIKGEPGVLPNGVQRICTGYLKVRTMTKFAASEWGVKKGEFEARLGLRADEEERLKNAQEWGNDGGRAVFPLDTAGVVKADVKEFWAKQGWGITIKAHEGNCGGCYMKRRGALLNLIRRDFFDVQWWADWEKRTGQRFRSERSYRSLINAAKYEIPMFEEDDLDNAITCDGGYCSN